MAARFQDAVLSGFKQGAEVTVVASRSPAAVQGGDGVISLAAPTAADVIDAAVGAAGRGDVLVLGHPGVASRDLAWAIEALGERGDLCRCGGVLLFTSGTTGRPRGVLHDWSSLLWGAMLAAEAQGLLDDVGPLETRLARAAGLQTGLRLGSTFSPATISGLVTLLRSVVFGDHFVDLHDAAPDQWIDYCLAQGLDSLGTSPFGVRLLTRGVARRRTRVGLLGIGVGSARLSPDDAARAEEVLEAAVFRGYGATELGGPVCAAAVLDPPAVRHQTVGRVLASVSTTLQPFPGLTGQDQLFVETPAMALAILEGATISSLASPYATGDLAFLHSSGSMEISGRCDDVILRNGRRIDPRQLEEVFGAHPDVSGAAVIGLTSVRTADTEIVALVESSASTPAVLREWAVARLPAHEMPRWIQVVRELPRLHDGTPDRMSLRHRFRPQATDG